MKKVFKAVAAVLMASTLACPVLFAGCGGEAEYEDYAYEKTDKSGYDSAKLEETAAYSVFYRPAAGAIGGVMPYFYNGNYYLFYNRVGDGYENSPVYVAKTADFVTYGEEQCVLSAIALSGEDELGAGSVAEYRGTSYVFYTGNNRGRDNYTVRVATANDDFTKLERKQDFILRGEDYGFEGGLKYPDVRYDEVNRRFNCVVATHKHGRAVLALFYLGTSVASYEVEYGGIIYEDTHGFDGIVSPSLFKSGEKWYLTYSAEKATLSGGDAYRVANSQQKVYYMHADSVEGSFVEEDCTQLDSNVFYGAKYLSGEKDMLVGYAYSREQNEKFGYGAAKNFAAHALYAEGERLLLTSPDAYATRFAVKTPIKSNKLDIGGDPVAVADELTEYRLSGDLTLKGNVEKFTLCLGYKEGVGAQLKVAVDIEDGTVKAMNSTGAVADGKLKLNKDTKYKLELYTEGALHVLYINGQAFTFTARDCGNKKIAAYAEGGSATLENVKLYGGGNVRTYSENVTMSVGAVKEYSIQAEHDSYIQAEVTVFSEEPITVTFNVGGEMKSATVKGLTDFTRFLPAKAGETGTVTIEASDITSVKAYIKLSESYYVPDCEAVGKRVTVDRGASLSLQKGKYYRFNAAAAQAVNCEGVLEITLDGEVINSSKLSEGFAKTGGAFYAEENCTLVAGVNYGGEAESYEALLTVYEADTEMNMFGGSDAAYVKGESVGASVSTDDRTDMVEAATAFSGVQGANGFVYIFGEDPYKLSPIENYDSETAAYGQAGNEVSADSITAAAGKVAGLAYVFAEDGCKAVTCKINALSATETEGGKYVLVQLFVNDFAIAEELIKVGSEEKEITKNVFVAKGDELRLAVSNAGNGTATAEYELKLENVQIIDSDDDVPGRVDYSKEFYTDLADENAWLYGMSTKFNWSNETFTFVRFTTFSGDHWMHEGYADIELKKGWLLNENGDADMAIGYKIDKDSLYSVKVIFDGTNAETRFSLRVFVQDAEGNNKSAPVFYNPGEEDWTYETDVIAENGNRIFVVFFREGGAWTQGSFNIQITDKG